MEKTSRTKLVPITTVSPLPGFVLNALIGPFLRAKTTGYNARRLNFLTDVEHRNSTAVDAPVGYLPSGEGYADIFPPLHALDPTSKVALSTKLFHENDRTSTIGRTSTIREKMVHYVISGQFAEWWREFCLIAHLAAAVDVTRASGRKIRLHPNREVFEGDGRIEAFLMAVGDLNDPIVGMNDHDDVDVRRIFDAVQLRLKSVMHAIGQDGFSDIMKDIANSYGFGMDPVAKGEVALIRAHAFEKLYAGNIKRLLTVPHARRMLRHVVESRIAIDACGIDEAYTITQSHDTLVIPGSIMASGTTPAAVFDAMCAAVDARQALSTAMYQSPNFEFSSQFYTKGDLVEALFVEETVDPLHESRLNVLMSMPVQSVIEGVSGVGISDYVFGTGGLGSTQEVRVDRINPIMGMDPYYMDVDSHVVGSGSLGSRTFTRDLLFQLPNQELSMSSCGDTTAFSWIRFLEWYGRAQSSDLKVVLSIGGASKTLEKQDLKLVNATLANPLTAYAKLNNDSQRDGVTQRAFASFNLGKYNRVGQQGPVMLDNSHHVGPVILAGSNEWTRTEPSTHMTRPSIHGGTLGLDVALDSGFVGEPQGSKTPSPYLPKGIAVEEQLGMNDAEMAVALNIMSLPLDLEGKETLSHTRVNIFANVNTFSSGDFNQRAGNLAKSGSWNVHPLTGFKRGYVFGRTSQAGFSTPSNVITALSGWSRSASSGAIVFSYSPTPGGAASANRTIAFPSGSSTSASSTIDQIAYLKGIDYQSQAYSGNSSDEDLMRSRWYWDPSQTNAAGNTNYALKGEYCNSLCFAAGYAIHPDVAVGAIETRDLNGDSPNTETTTGSIFVLSEEAMNRISVAGGTTPRDYKNGPFAQTRDIAILDARIEQENSTYPAVLVTNGWFDCADIVSDAWANQHDGDVGFAIVSNEVYDASASTLGSYTVIDDFNMFRKLMSVTNPYATCVNALTGYGLNATDGSYTGAVHWPINVQNSMPNFFNGPSIAPLNGAHSGYTVTGVGQVHHDDRDTFAHSLLSAVCTRLLNVSEETVPAHYPLGNLAEQVEAWKEQGSGAVSTGPFPSIPNIACESNDALRLSNLPDFVPVTEPWYLNVGGRVPAVTPRSISERRGDALMGVKNPWMRATNAESGWKVGNYDSQKATVMIGSMIRDAMLDAGGKLLTGMSNADWRDLYVRL